MPSLAYAGQTILFTATAPFKNSTLAFGDGVTTIVPFGTTAVAHVYANPGAYTATLSAPIGVAPLSVQTTVRIAPVSGALIASPVRNVVGEPIAFAARDIAAPGFPAPPPLMLSFGDGTAPLSVPASGTYSHAFANPGIYVAQLLTSTGALVASAAVEADARTARVPIGEIFNVTPSLSPALAGSDIALIVNYNLLLPPTAYASELPALDAIVDLLAPDGRLIRRSDPFPIAYSAAGGPVLRTARIPYTVPVDAGGAYKLRVYLRSEQGGTVALAQPIPLLVTAGPDPAPKAIAAVHAGGALEVGPHASQSPATLNANLTAGLQWPASTLAFSGLFDPVSRRVDPKLWYSGGPPPKIVAPDSQQGQPQGNPDATLGFAQATLPSILGGGDPLRGFRWIDASGPFTYQFGYGYTQLGSTTQSPQYGSIFEVTRALPRAGGLDFTLFAHADDANGYVPNGSIDAAPYSSHAAVLEYHEQPMKNLTLVAAGALANAEDELDAQHSQSDASDKLQLQYASGSTNASIEYDNAGEYMGLGGGPGALADRADLLSQLQLPLSRISTLALGFNRMDTRSAFSRQTDTYVAYTLTPPALSYTLSFRSDGQRASGVETLTNQIGFGVSKSGAGWNFAFNANLSALRDALGNASSTTRTAALQYTRQVGRHTLSFGIDANAVAGASGSAQVGETLSYGFPFATRANGNGFELITQLGNTVSSSASAAARDDGLTAILSYHMGTHVSLGIVGDFRSHYAPFPRVNQSASALRARLDVQL